MRIVFVSYEFPPDTGGGGIGTYLAQVAPALAAAGHDVHVFAGSSGSAASSRLVDGVTIHRIPSAGSMQFRFEVLTPFLDSHRAHAFDVVEGTDFDASALEIKRALPRLPYVVKLHTPRFLVDEMNYRAPSASQRLRMALGALCRGRLPGTTPIRAQPPAFVELDALRMADGISAPSTAIAEAAKTWTTIDRHRIDLIPLPYKPSPELLGISSASSTNRVTFIGRLEERKGVVDLADSVSLVLAARPDARFRYVGRSMPSSHGGLAMQSFLEKRLGRHASAAEFTGPRPPSEVPKLLAESDILAVPSHWESFGLVCCEGMAAARAVVGGACGAMSEILGQGAYGVVVEPRDPPALARAIIRLLSNPAERQRLGEAGRNRVLEHYSLSRILPAQLKSYRDAIARCSEAIPSSS